MMIYESSSNLINSLRWCGKVVNGPLLGATNKLRSESLSSKYSRKCYCRILDEKKSWNSLYFSQLQSYEIHAKNILFFMAALLIGLFFFLGVYRNFT